MNKNLFYFVLIFAFVFITQPLKSNINDVSLYKSNTSSARAISKVESIKVDCPIGTVPRLPYQVWVTYSDGKSEYRQVRWSNSTLATELEQADPIKNPVGSKYSIKGFIIGDNTTDSGFPIEASIIVVSGAAKAPSNVPIAEPIPLNQVILEGENRLTSNRELAIREIISWDVSQQLYNYRDTYGLSTDGYKKADGWDSPTTKLKGHGSGHYMSALAFAFASSTDVEQKMQLRNNMRRMVDELRECQERTFVWNDELGRYWEARDFAPEEELKLMKGTWDDFDIYKTEWNKYGYGYLNAIPAHHPVLNEMYRAYNNSDWVWAPYYSIHKQLAGLIDISTYVDDSSIADKALLIAKDMGLWIWNRLHYRTFVDSEGSQSERRAKPGNRFEMWNIYIAGEDGGVGESLARLSEMVKDSVEKTRLLEASNFFDTPPFYDPLSINVDEIRTRHANQHIPKITSALRSFRGNSNNYYYNLSENFWHMIQGRYRYATGGVGNGEMFRQPYTQVLSMATNVTSDNRRNLHPAPYINETCCAYNLAKLTKDLNTFNPDDAKYMDYYERLLYNQLVGSLNHHYYQTTYQYSVGLDATKQFGNETPQSTCCGGTGSENHVKYQEAAYFTSDNTIWVALYLPTTFKWAAQNVIMKQECSWPSEYSTIKVTEGSSSFAMKLRVPYWATEGFDVKLNGKSIASHYNPSSYVTIPSRKWSESDIVEIIMPFSKHIDYGPDKLETAATDVNVTNTSFSPMWVGTLMYGPFAMATTGVSSWEDAIIDIESDLDNIEAKGAQPCDDGADANLYTLVLKGKEFTPDYYQHKNITHYFRINQIESFSDELRKELYSKLQKASIYTKNGYTKSSYSRLIKAVKKADKTYRIAELTQQGLDSELASIDNAISNLITRKPDKSLLQSSIREAESKSKDQYTWSSFENLKNEVSRANIVLSNGYDQKEIDETVYDLNNAISHLSLADEVEKSTLRELLYVARQRKDMQDKWNLMSVKVPEYSPWAPNGFERMDKQLTAAQKVYDNADKNYSQTEVNEMASNLNASINTMRPGNLPELEDLGELLTLLDNAKSVNRSLQIEELLDNVAYAEMVVKYVGDGSGTHDMIENAIKRLSESLNKIN